MGELDALDIPYGSIHKIEYADLGRCLDNGISCYKGVFDIQISNLFKKAGIDILDLKATVMHELLHTCAGCDNHNGMCRGYAALADFCIPLWHPWIQDLSAGIPERKGVRNLP